MVLAACGGQEASSGEDEGVPVMPSVSAVNPDTRNDAPADQLTSTEIPETLVPDLPADEGSVQPEAAVALCPYYEPSGIVVSAPCDPALIDPSRQLVPVQQPAPTQEATTITCDTVCTSSGCEQYQYSVLNCP